MFDNGGCLIPKLIEYLNENMINMVMFIFFYHMSSMSRNCIYALCVFPIATQLTCFKKGF